MNTKELAKYIGEIATWKVGSLSFNVEVLDARFVWGKVQFQIKPESGTGEQWVENLLFQSPAVKGAGVCTAG